MTPLAIFAGSPKPIKDMSQEEIVGYMQGVMGNAPVWRSLQAFFDKNLTMTNVRATYARSIL